jgi:hypothetical protein
MQSWTHRKVNSWVAITLFLAMTLWVCTFYYIETRKLYGDDFTKNYRIYYELTHE